MEVIEVGFLCALAQRDFLIIGGNTFAQKSYSPDIGTSTDAFESIAILNPQMPCRILVDAVL